MITDPTTITVNSFQMIRRELGSRAAGFSPAELSVVERVIHSTADFEFVETLAWSDDAIQRGVEALRAGANVICDVTMVRVGISQRRLGEFGGQLHTFIADEDVYREARAEGTTRSLVSMRKAARLGMNGDILVIGNAPTALFELIRLVREEGHRPALIIGVPVGFVSTVESKEALSGLNEVSWITTHGRKGGSPVAVAIVNALLRLAAEAPPTETD